MSIYSAFSKSKYELSDETIFIVENCLVSFLDEKKIYIDLFERLVKYGNAGGEFCGIQVWDENCEEDHGIKEKFNGYLFFLDGEIFNDYSSENLQVILTKEQIKPFIKDIINWYAQIPNSGVEEFITLVTQTGFYP